MWERGWRDRVWSSLDQGPLWDILIIGGGITGAGILREAARLGLRAALVEQRDFAWGASSRSSKLVHGGLRYLKTGDVALTRTSVHERERLLRDGAGLITPLGFLLPVYKGDHPGRWTYDAGLTLYDSFGATHAHRFLPASEVLALAPHLARHHLQGAFWYHDAQTDDARLVLRLLREACAAGALALNYAEATSLLRDGDRVVGVALRDLVAGRSAQVRARVVVNATGAWADRLRAQVDRMPRLRPLRGSHLIFPAWCFPLAQAIGFPHPVDGRSVFALPWEGVTLVGTTDVDHPSLRNEPSIHPDEVAYLMAAAAARFPSLDLTLDDVLAAYAGVRPVIGTGKADPSHESRDHAVWEEHGLLTVTGGKLTTFRHSALEALRHVRHARLAMPCPDPLASALDPTDAVTLPPAPYVPPVLAARLLGRHGAETPALLAATTSPDDLQLIPTTRTPWAEVRWAARAEGVVHLDDLLLRRTRLGLQLPAGARQLLPTIRAICQSELGWDDARWQSEQDRYLDLWRAHYSLPDRAAIPDWHALLTGSRASRRHRSAVLGARYASDQARAHDTHAAATSASASRIGLPTFRTLALGSAIVLAVTALWRLTAGHRTRPSLAAAIATPVAAFALRLIVVRATARR